jgi:hypothetical protein
MHNIFWRKSQNALLKSAIRSYKNDGTPRSFQRACAEIINHTKEINTQTNIRTENSEPLH